MYSQTTCCNLLTVSESKSEKKAIELAKAEENEKEDEEIIEKVHFEENKETSEDVIIEEDSSHEFKNISNFSKELVITQKIMVLFLDYS